MQPEPLASAAFVSDVHLSADDPQTAERFFGWLDAVRDRAQALFVLGDLFDAWVGDDDLDAPLAVRLRAALRALADGGMRVFLMRGNRDFLIDAPGAAAGAAAAATAADSPRTGSLAASFAAAGFSASVRAQLLDDPVVVSIAGQAIVLTHGDALCTDDADYQAWRAQVRAEPWQRAFLAQPLAARQQIAARLRGESEAAKRDKPLEIMDANAAAIETLLRAQGVTRMIHGHTHRPAAHRFVLDGRACERWVLPDWSAAADRGGGLLIDASGWTWLDTDGAARGEPPQ